jgi:hypothetical protein
VQVRRITAVSGEMAVAALWYEHDVGRNNRVWWGRWVSYFFSAIKKW